MGERDGMDPPEKGSAEPQYNRLFDIRGHRYRNTAAPQQAAADYIGYIVGSRAGVSGPHKAHHGDQNEIS